MDGQKAASPKPMLLLTCLMAGLGIGILAHTLLGENDAAAKNACGTLDIAGLNKMIADTDKAASSGIAARLVSQYAADAVVIGRDQSEWLKGHSQLMPHIYNMMKSLPNFQLTPKEQGIGCAQAWSAGDALIKWTDAKTSKKMSANYRYSLVYRFENGVWKIAHMHLSAGEKQS